MYKTSAIGPVFLIQSLVTASAIGKGSKIILVSSESGSITLRHESEGGGMYGHHGSKAALNMVGKLLAFDLESKGIAVGLVHPGFMRTEMTKSVGFDEVSLSPYYVSSRFESQTTTVLGLGWCSIARRSRKELA
jgi:NAD(P)-dependent dehydrogenase (short-subunit alcohol dehydrogenase family)